MAVGAIKYIANIGKSVAYSAVDQIKDLNPAVSEFAEQNADLGRVLYQSAKDIKGTSAALKKMAIESKVGEFAVEYKKAFFEDLKTGKFYNKDRIDEMQVRASGSLLDFDLDDPFSDSSSDDGMFGDDSPIGDDDIFLANQVDRVGEKTAVAIAEATGRSAEYIVQSNKQATSSMQKHNTLLNNRLHIGLAAINSSISNIIQFNDKVARVHVDNSKLFYETSNRLDSERNELLKKILESQTSMSNSMKKSNNNKSNRNISYSDIVGAEGIPDLVEYSKRVMQNVNSMTGSIMDMNEIFEGGNLLLTLAGSPLKTITDGLMKSLIPSTAKVIMDGFNNTISGLFGSTMSKLGTMRNNDNIPEGLKIIAKIFGVETGLRTKYDTSKYEKGAVPFDGVTKMAITQVIPMHLAKIEAALSGQTERMFDYKTGKFANLQKLSDDYNSITTNYAKEAASEIRAEMEELLKSVKMEFSQRKTLEKDMNKVFEKSYRDGVLLDLKGANAYDWDIDERSLITLKNLLNNIDRGTRMRHNKKVWEGRDRQRNIMTHEQDDPTSIYRLLMNDFDINQYSNKKDGRYLEDYDLSRNKGYNRNARTNSLVLSLDNKGHNLFYYLQRMTADIEKISHQGTSGRGLGSASNAELIGVPTASGFETYSDMKRRQYNRDEYRYDSIQDRDHRRNNITIQRPKRYMALDRKNKRLVRKGNMVVGNKGYYFDDEDLYYSSDGDIYDRKQASHFEAQAEYLRETRRVDSEKQRQKSPRSKFMNKILDTDLIGDGLKSFIVGLDEIADKPLNTIAKMLNKVDERLFNIIYGDTKSEEFDDDGSRKKLDPKSFMGVMMYRMKDTFRDITTSIREDILLPLKDVLFGDDFKESFKTFFSNILGHMGIDTKDIRQRVSEGSKSFTKKAFARPYGYAKNAMMNAYRPVKQAISGQLKGTYTDEYASQMDAVNTNEFYKREKAKSYSDFFGGISIKDLVMNYGSGRSKESRIANEENTAYVLSEIAKGRSVSELIDDGFYNTILDLSNTGQLENIDSFARGSRLIKKTGLAVLSEGEMVIPSELNPFYRKRTNKSQEIHNENKVKHGFRNKIKGFAKGSPDIDIDPDGFANNTHKKSKGRYKGGEYGPDVFYDTYKRYRYDENSYEEGQEPLVAKTAKVGRRGVNKVLSRLGLLKTKASDMSREIKGFKSSDKLFDDALSDVTKDFTKYLPESVGGAIIGGGLSLITGAIGGPLLGAAVGAGTSLIIQSDKVRDWLFGEMVTEDGKEVRSGNIIQKDLANNIRKYLPDMASGATVGAITSILPFVPGGPVAGIIIGSSIGFAKNSDKVQNMLFGKMNKTTGERDDNGIFKKEFMKNLKDRIPEMTLGGLGGLVFGGPFGLVGNIALGASIGFLSQTTKFQETLFGKYNEETDEYEGGILGTLKTKFIDPIAQSVKPFAKQMELGVKGLFGFLKNSINKIFGEELRVPLRHFFMERLLKPMGNAAKKTAKFIAKPAVSLLSAPFRAVGAAGDALRRRHIAGGNATYMTAQDRLDYREEYSKKLANRKFFKPPFRTGLKKDKFDDFDNLLVDTSDDNLRSMSESLSFMRDPDKESDRLKKSAGSAIRDLVINDAGLDYSDYKSILKSLKGGDSEAAFARLRRAGLSPEEQQRVSLSLSKNYADYQTAGELKEGGKGIRGKLYEKLDTLGLKGINDSNLDKYRKLIDNELNLREKSPEEWFNEKEDKRHDIIVSLFKDAIDVLKLSAKPNTKEADKIRTDMFNRNMKNATKRTSFARVFDSGDSGLYGDFKFRFRDGQLVRYRLDPETGEEIDVSPIDSDSMMPLDEEGNTIYDKYGIGNDFDGNTDRRRKTKGFFRNAVSGIKRGTSAAWNFRAGSFMADKVSNIFNRSKTKDAESEAQKAKHNTGDEDESDENVQYKYDFMGNPIKWVKLKSGRWDIDDDDAQNRKYTEENDLKKGFNSIGDKLSDLNYNLTGEEDEPEDRAERKRRNKKSKKKKDDKEGGGIISKLFKGTVGLITTPLKFVTNMLASLFGIKSKDGTIKKGAKIGLGVFGIWTGASILNAMDGWWTKTASPALKGFWDDKIYPKISRFIEPIRPTLLKVATGLDMAINSIPSAIERLGSRIKSFIIDDLPKTWSTKIVPFYQGGAEFIVDKLSTVTEWGTYLLLKALPKALKGVFKGTMKFLRNDIYTLFGGVGRPKDLSTKEEEEVNIDKPKERNGRYFRGIYDNIFGSSTGSSDQPIDPDNTSEAEVRAYYENESANYPRKSLLSRISDKFTLNSEAKMGGVMDAIDDAVYGKEMSYSDSGSSYDYSNPDSYTSTTYSEDIHVSNTGNNTPSNNIYNTNGYTGYNPQDNSGVMNDKLNKIVNNNMRTTETPTSNSNPFTNNSTPYNNPLYEHNNLSNNNYGFNEEEISVMSNQNYFEDQSGNIFIEVGDGEVIDIDTGEIGKKEDMPKDTKGVAFGSQILGRMSMAPIRSFLTGNAGIFGKFGKKIFKFGWRPRSGLLKNTRRIIGGTIGSIFGGTGVVSQFTAGITKGSTDIASVNKLVATVKDIMEAFRRFCDKFFSSFINDPKIKRRFKDSVIDSTARNPLDGETVNGMKEFANKMKNSSDDIMSDAAAKAVKDNPKFAAKALDKFKNGLKIFKWLTFLYDFTKGYHDAGIYLDIIDEDVTPTMRFLVGVTNLITQNLFIGLLSTRTVLDFVINIFRSLGIFKNSLENLEELRDFADTRANIHNEVYGTKYENVEQYNKRRSLWKKVTRQYTSKDKYSEDTAYHEYYVEEAKKQQMQDKLNTNRISKYILGDSEDYSGVGEVSRSILDNKLIFTNPMSRSAISARGSGLPYTQFSAGGSGISDTALANEIMALISSNETSGRYDSVNANDGGSMSIGKYQFNANAGRAQELLAKMAREDQDAVRNALGTDLYGKVVSNNDKALAGFIPNSEQEKRIKELLGSPLGKRVQDEHMLGDVKKYMGNAKTMGVKDASSVMYISDMIHQGGPGRVEQAVIRGVKEYGASDLDTVVKATKNWASFLYKPEYLNRRNKTYNIARQLDGMKVDNTSFLSANTDSATTEGGFFVQFSDALNRLANAWMGIPDSNNQPTPTMINYDQDYNAYSIDNVLNGTTTTNKISQSTKEEKLVASRNIKNVLSPAAREKSDYEFARGLLFDKYKVKSEAELGRLMKQQGLESILTKDSVAGTNAINKYVKQMNTDSGFFTGTKNEAIVPLVDKAYLADGYQQALKSKQNRNISIVDRVNSRQIKTPIIGGKDSKADLNNYTSYFWSYDQIAKYIYSGSKPSSFLLGNRVNDYYTTYYEPSIKAEYNKLPTKQKKSALSPGIGYTGSGIGTPNWVNLQKILRSKDYKEYEKAFAWTSEGDKIIDRAVRAGIAASTRKSDGSSKNIVQKAEKSFSQAYNAALKVLINRGYDRNKAINELARLQAEEENKAKPKARPGNNARVFSDTRTLSAKGSFISQLDPMYANRKFGNETIGMAGCGPAVASMAISDMSAKGTIMDSATSIANRYRDSGGTNAAYFKDIFGRAGANTQYHSGSNRKSMIESSLSRGEQVVLMGRDSANRTKANSPFGPNNHYVLAKGMKGNKVLINDPELSGPKIYDKSILNNTRLGISISGRGSGAKKNTKYRDMMDGLTKIQESLVKATNAFTGGHNESNELGDGNLTPTQIGDNSNVLGSNDTVGVNDSVVKSIIALARSYVGKLNYSQAKRYEINRGGGYADCSSFVHYVYKQNGINIGTWTGSIIRNGIEIGKNDLQAGDLVMFKNTTRTPTTNHRGVTHVGIYVGNDRLIHMSSGANKVIEITLSTSNLYKNNFLCGRRVINTSSGSGRGSGINSDMVISSAKGSNIISNRTSAPTNNTAPVSNPFSGYNNMTAQGSGLVGMSGAGSGTNSMASVKLLETIVRLLGQMVNDTGNIKDIINLLTQILGKADSSKASNEKKSKDKSKAIKDLDKSIERSAVDVLSQYSQDDQIDMGNLINDLSSILKA